MINKMFCKCAINLRFFDVISQEAGPPPVRLSGSIWYFNCGLRLLAKSETPNGASPDLGMEVNSGGPIVVWSAINFSGTNFVTTIIISKTATTKIILPIFMLII